MTKSISAGWSNIPFCWVKPQVLNFNLSLSLLLRFRLEAALCGDTFPLTAHWNVGTNMVTRRYGHCRPFRRSAASTDQQQLRQPALPRRTAAPMRRVAPQHTMDDVATASMRQRHWVEPTDPASRKPRTPMQPTPTYPRVPLELPFPERTSG